MSHDISIIIPTHNRARLLRGTLMSLGRVRVPEGCECELLVIDNNCTDDTARVVEESTRTAKWPVRRVVEIQQGLGHARNRGLREARFSHAAYFDDDVEVSPEWLAGFLDAVAEYDADLVVGPVTPVFESPPPAYLTPRVVDSLGSSYSRKGDRALVLTGNAAQEVPGCNFGFRKRAIEAIDGFDSSLDRSGGELLAGGDFEMGARLAESRGVAVYEPRCAVKHIIPSTKTSREYLRRRWSGLGATRAILEQRQGTTLSPARKARYRLGIVFGALRVLGLCLVGRRAQAFEQELQWRMGMAYLAAHVRGRMATA